MAFLAQVKIPKSLTTKLERIIKAGQTPKLDHSILERGADDFLKEMKRDILSGLSPIKGMGRFPAYKNPKKYPANKKPQRPVNLYLTGEFLSDLYTEIDSYARVIVGYVGTLSINKEEGHREGVNTQPKRPTIPENRESFNEKLLNILRKSYRKALEKFID